MLAELAHRWWRRSPWFSNPLMRLPDRIERTAFVVGVAVLLLLIPVAATIGSVTYSDLSSRSQQQRAEYVRVDARVIDTVQSTGTGSDSTTLATGIATVQWNAPDGSIRSESTEVPSDVQIGETTPIWCDANGTLVHAPVSAVGAVINGASTAMFVWVLGAVLVGFSIYLTTVAGDRVRMRHWDSDWKDFLQARNHPSR
ncbi:Rv1733c family protein [Rhodococcus sp. IEGM 1354]|uniref:Rv1733c family protein n=1 Tax=Rhodococcus sp. IEGM 1354 TaxID=3047088 RepID=UPI003FA7C619